MTFAVYGITQMFIGPSPRILFISRPTKSQLNLFSLNTLPKLLRSLHMYAQNLLHFPQE